MSGYSNWGTMTTNGYSLTVSGGEGKKAPETPAGLIVTRAVETKEGWFGHVLVDKEIVFQTEVLDSGHGAIQAANERVVDAIKALFASPTT